MNTELSPRRLLAVIAALTLLALLPAGPQRPRPTLQAAPTSRLSAAPQRTAAPTSKRLPVGAEVHTATGERRRILLGDGAVLYVNENTRLKRLDAWQVRLSGGEVCLELGRKSGHDVLLHGPRREVVAHPGSRVALQAGKEGDEVLVAHGEAEVKGVEHTLHAGQRMPSGAARLVPAPRASFTLAWARELMAQNEPRLVPASANAGGRLVARDPEQGEADLSLRRYHIDVHVEDGFARTVIDQTYFNDSNTRLEGTFYFPLPADASLSQLVMYVDGQRRDGSMVERDRARAVYEQIVYQQKDPALLEWVDGSTFKMRVFPLEPRQEKRILLGYTQKLPSLYGQTSYHFPAGHTLQNVRDWSFHMRVKKGAPMGWTSSGRRVLRETKDGADLLLDAVGRDVALEGADVSINLMEAAGGKVGATHLASIEQDGAKYLLVRTRPDLPALAEQKRRDWVFLFESSGDRDPLLARAQVEIVRHLLDSAGPDDTFLVLTANTRVRAFAEQPRSITEENVRAAVGFLEGSHLIGALDIGHAFHEAGKYLRSAKDPYFVHVGSGIAAMGERRNEELARTLPRAAPYIGIAVGKRWNRALMKAAAERSAGYFTQINPDESIPWRTFELAATLNTPRLLDVNMIDSDGKVTFLPMTRLAAQGEEITAIARIDSKDTPMPQKVLLHGQLNGRSFERELSVRDVASEAGYLPREWARLEIEHLLAEDGLKHKQRIIELSKAMTVVTPFTSLLVLENDEMEKQYKVEHGRREVWAAYPCPERIEVVYEPEDGPPGDPRKGIKPAPRQVAKTILMRQPPSVMQWLEENEEEKAPGAGTTGNLVVGVRTLEMDVKTGKPHSGSSLALPSLNVWVGVYDGESKEKAGENRPIGVLGSFRSRMDLGGSPFGSRSQNNLGVGGGVIGFGGGQPGQLGMQVGKTSSLFSRATHQPRDWAQNYNPIDGTPLDQTVELDQAEAEAAPDKVQLPRVPAHDASLPTLSLERMLSSSVESLLREGESPALLYQRPRYRNEDRVFFDLVSHAPGMNTSSADIQAILEREAVSSARNKLGTIDDTARALFERARTAGWRTCTLPGKSASSELTFSFDGQDRYAWERTLSSGLREQVVCDGKTLWHLYPEIGLAAERTLSRFHRVQLAALTPGFLPRPEDLARGADLLSGGKNRVALVPHGGRARPHRRLVFLFGKDGQLAEQQVVQMPQEKVLAREIYEPGGKVRLLDEKGKEVRVLARALQPCEQAPRLTPDLRRLVVLPLPYRTMEHVLQQRRLEKTAWAQLRFEDGRALLASLFAANQGEEAGKLCQSCFFQRDQHDLGLYVLLAACGQNLDGEHTDVLAQHPGDPLAQYLALYSSPVLRKHASQWAVRSSPWSSGLLQRLSLAHALLQRWEADRPLPGRDAQQHSEVAQAGQYARDNPRSPFSLALLLRIEERLQEEGGKSRGLAALYRELARAWQPLQQIPGLEDLACYERARCLWKGGDEEAARRLFLAYYEDTSRKDALPAIDGDFRRALLQAKERSWPVLIQQTARRWMEQKRRQEVLALALQCWQVEDPDLSDRLLSLALEGAEPGTKGRPVRYAALEVLYRTGRLAPAQKLLTALLEEAPEQERALLWRLAAHLAQSQRLPARKMECLEKALTIEYEHLPEIINRVTVRENYQQLLEHYQTLAESLAALHLEPPKDFLDRVVRSADRWRALDPDNPAPCQLAAGVLRALGERDLMWDYLTTPVGRQPNESKTWRELAEELQGQGELKLADRAYSAACAAAPTDADLLWQHAQSLRQAGRLEEARRLYRRLAEGSWQPRFRYLQEQAREELR